MGIRHWQITQHRQYAICFASLQKQHICPERLCEIASPLFEWIIEEERARARKNAKQGGKKWAACLQTNNTGMAVPLRCAPKFCSVSLRKTSPYPKAYPAVTAGVGYHLPVSLHNLSLMLYACAYNGFQSKELAPTEHCRRRRTMPVRGNAPMRSSPDSRVGHPGRLEL